jgi:hypothetical protein
MCKFDNDVRPVNVDDEPDGADWRRLAPARIEARDDDEEVLRDDMASGEQ